MSHPFTGDGREFPFSSALREAFVAADASHRASLEVLRDAICEYAEDLRDRGLTRGDIANAIRLRVTDLRSSGAVASDGKHLERLVDEMVGSCLDPAR